MLKTCSENGTILEHFLKNTPACADACFTKQWQKVLSSPCFCLQCQKYCELKRYAFKRKYVVAH